MNPAKKILVIDDDKLVRQSVERVLKMNGYQVLLAENANDALLKAENESFDLIISDIRMPGKNGVEAAHEIRRLFDEKTRKDIPIIFITGFADESQALDAEKLGEVILKPFDVERLIVTVREYL